MSTTMSPATMRDTASLSEVLETIAFPAARDDLLLHAVASHATPALIGDLRSLAEPRFSDADSVRAALAAI